MSAPSDNALFPRTISELVDLPLKFQIEKYQRGYKWVKRQVEDLLADIEAFRQKMLGDPARPEFYSLQPVVVKRQADGEHWELIDGQQRLTTIYLILSNLGKARFEIDYRTRAASGRFLRELPRHSITRTTSWGDFRARNPYLDNIDNFHFFAACKAIDEWFATCPDRDAFHDTLLHRTQVIWYEVRDETTSRDIFIRLNSGKIELTPAELIKALFFRRDPSAGGDEDHRLRQAEIAIEWDQIEYALQDDSFWYFIHRRPGKNIPSARIEFLFDLISRRHDRDDDKHSFRYFEKATKEDAEAAWKKVTQCFDHLQEWNKDHTLYHRIGFILTRGPDDVTALLEEAFKRSKDDFAKYVTERIRTKVSKIPLGELVYNEHDETLVDVLLLFNLETLIASRSNARFPFDRYKTAQWSLEHIHAQNSKALSDQQERVVWYRHYEDMLHTIRRRLTPADRDQVDPRVTEMLSELIRWYEDKSKSAEEAPVNLERRINKLADDTGNGDDDDENPLHGIGNLALLGRNANSALGNAIFPNKRESVIGMDQEGNEFVPVATKNVFLKYYTHHAVQMGRWDRADRENYRRAIATALEKYGVR